MNDVDYLVVGAGPAGLAAASYLAERGRSFLLVEQGVAVGDRRHDTPEHLGQGVGGAGLYSDGKFSFFPSASALWMLRDRAALLDSYARVTNLLANIGISAPPFPEVTLPQATGTEREKRYQSIYASLESRTKLIDLLAGKLSPKLSTGSKLLALRTHEDHLRAYVWSLGGHEDFRVRATIWCGGRFGPLSLAAAAPDLPRTFRRFEIGVRIEQPTDAFFLAHYDATDIKLISTCADPTTEWRTFCTCRNGEIVRVAGSPHAISGRADGASTGRTNIGLNLRLTALPTSESILREIDSILLGNTPEFQQTLRDYLVERRPALGRELDILFKDRLRTIVPDEQYSSTSIHGPAVEGVGYYPDVNDDLKVNSYPIWVAGDSSGLFRGLTAALVSGYYAAARAEVHWSGTQTVPSFVKVSPTRPMRKVFTAQSKAFFYCRDAVCEFCLTKGVLPINPFRIFDYFLGDRVDRNIVRRGNNQLVVDCDELWVFGPISDGVLYEIVRARQTYKPVKFFTIATRSSEIAELPTNQVTFEPEIHSRQITRETLLALINDDIAIDSLEPLQLDLDL